MNDNADKLSVTDVLQTIQQELREREEESKLPDEFTLNQRNKSNKLYVFAKRVGRYLHGKGLHRLVYFVQMNMPLHKNKVVYELGEFMMFHDEEFIDNAYKKILNREADNEGSKYYLSQLRKGVFSKIDIIVFLHFSKEGIQQNVVIPGSKKRYILARLSKLPYLGYVFRLGLMLATLPRLLQRINRNENSTSLQLYKIDKELIQLQLQINNRVKDLEALIQIKIEALASKQEILTYLQTVDYAKEHMRISQQNIQTMVDEVKTRLPSDDFSSQELIALASEEQHKFDALYVEFEDEFRGTREDIKERVQVYLPYLEALPFKKENIEILDVGCGRAEWLEVLKENEYKSKGIDLNRVMVSFSQEKGYDVSQNDVIEYLKGLAAETLNVITGFHIIEHLPFEVLMQLFEESYRVLKKGGLIIFETPNPENILVGSHYFYTDPTHISPLVPATIEFLVKQSGFKQVEIKRLHENTEYLQIESDFIKNNVSIAMDYSVIGYKA